MFHRLVTALLALALAVASGAELSENPFASPARVRVLLFVRSDCPITNRYAPELQRIANDFKGKPVRFWLVYADRSETAATIHSAIAQYGFPGTPLLDPQHTLVKRAGAVTAPSAAVFDWTGALLYSGRIDDRYVDVGKARPEAQVHDLKDAISGILAGKPVKQARTRAIGCSLADVE